MAREIKFQLTFNHYFMFLMLILGALLFYSSWDIDAQLQDRKVCVSKDLKTYNKIVLCIGLTLIISSLSFFSCSYFSDRSFSDFTLDIYLGLLILLSIGLIYLGYQISQTSTGDCAVGNSNNIWISGLVILILALLFLRRKLNVKRDEPKKESKKEDKNTGFPFKI
jgi:hypothetical protein